MESEPYQRVGRGGAGNYYTQQDINDAARRTASDLESQAPNTSTTTTTATASAQTPSYIPSGRGGAGNFISASAAASAKAAEPLSTTIATTTTERKEPQLGRTYGRGGAGNFGSGEEERRKEEERKREEERRGYERVVRDVEMGLQEPERAHLGGREGDGGEF